MGKIKKIFTSGELAKRAKKSRMWISTLWREGRLPHDLEDQSGRPYWFKPPKIELEKRGRKKIIEQGARPLTSRAKHGK